MIKHEIGIDDVVIHYELPSYRYIKEIEIGTDKNGKLYSIDIRDEPTELGKVIEKNQNEISKRYSQLPYRDRKRLIESGVISSKDL